MFDLAIGSEAFAEIWLDFAEFAEDEDFVEVAKSELEPDYQCSRLRCIREMRLSPFVLLLGDLLLDLVIDLFSGPSLVRPWLWIGICVRMPCLLRSFLRIRVPFLHIVLLCPCNVYPR